MRWSDRHRGFAPAAAAAVLGMLAFGATEAARAEEGPLEQRLAVVERTTALLVDKNEARAAELRARVRALYKLSRAGAAPLWIDADARTALLRRRGAARRILVRDLRELEILREELAVVESARSRIERGRDAEASVARPGRRSLVAPVRGAIVSSFGPYRGRKTKTRLTQRGVRLASTPGQAVVATHAGTVEYAGPVRGLDGAVVVAREDGVRSVIGHLAELTVARGDRVEAGGQLGSAAGRRVYLEVRLDVGAGGLPVDPAPLLAR